MNTYHKGRVLAIVCGIAATAGALIILLADPITTGNWRLDHVLLPLIAAITIASGHLFGSALREWRLLPALGFALTFAAGTVLTVYSSVGAQKSGAGARQEVAIVAHNQDVAAKRAELERARLRFDQANAQADREMSGQRCLARCNDWKLRAKEVLARISEIERELSSNPLQLAPSRARPFADAMGVIGFNHAKVELIAATFEPFAFSLLFELTAIVAFGFGFGHRKTATVAKISEKPARREPLPMDDEPLSRDEALANLKALLKSGQDIPSQEWLAERWNRSKGCASRWITQWEHNGELDGHRHPVGRCKTIISA